MAEPQKFEVNNMDISALIRYCKRFKFEVVKSVSANLAFVSEADRVRFLQYLDLLAAKVDEVVAQPQLDLPEWTPQVLDLGSLENLPTPENEALVTLTILYDALMVELANCQSARMSVGMIAPDEVRVRGIFTKMRSHINNFISVTQPVDVPESSPLRLNTGAGRTGI